MQRVPTTKVFKASGWTTKHSALAEDDNGYIKKGELMHTHNVWRTIDEVRFLEGLQQRGLLKKYRTDRTWEYEPFVDEKVVLKVLKRMLKEEEDN